jgi:hypothetical protein
MESTELITTGDEPVAASNRLGLPLALVTTIQLWADARTDSSSSRRRDLIRQKTSAVGAFFGDGNCAIRNRL